MLLKKQNRVINILINYSIVIGLLSLSRILFFLFNYKLFQASFPNLLIALTHGIRFDISSTLYFNAPYFLLIIIPFSNSIFEKIKKTVFVLINAFALMLNSIDFIYYSYTYKRSTADLFSFTGTDIDFTKLLPHFLIDYWYIWIIWLIMSFAIFYFYKIDKFNKQKIEFKTKNIITYILIVVLSLGIHILGMRGGTQLRPININSASAWGNTKLSPIVLNTPFTILQSFGKNELKIVKHFDNQDLEKLYTPIQENLKFNLLPDSITRNKNIVIVIVESLSQEHIAYYNPEILNSGNFTPFVNSLCEKSLCFDGIANGKKSNEAIPALVSSIPTLMSKPFISTPYSAMQHKSIASYLKKLNYKTHFFHGGTNGTMGFENYLKHTDFDKYFGRKEYNNEAHYDGQWGIWDEEFLYFCAETITQESTAPFLSIIFTLSSHHPYKIPEKYKDKFPKGEHQILETIAYADFALEKFFQEISKKDWFNNTLFVITGDHSSQSESKFYNNNYGVYKIPFIFYDPKLNLSEYSNKNIFQQIDLMPSLLAYLGFEEKIIAFGRNAFDTTEKNFAVQYLQPDFQFIFDDTLYIWNQNKITSAHSLKEDKMLINNIIDEIYYPKEKEILIKSYIQQYNNRLLLNQLMP